ncbi:MAG TPA: hypothetical protein VF487_00500 [Chitinophagaceae bacterium]
MPHDRHYYSKLFISITLFLVSGGLSTYLYYNLQGKGGVYFPGIFYTSTTIIIFLLTKRDFQIKNLLKYYFLMLLTYLVVWLLTMLSSWFVVFCGPVTAGVGAIATFILTDKFITKIKYNKIYVFIVGGLAFLLTDILYFTFNNIYDKPPIEYIFKVEIEPAMLFLELFAFWHVLVGTKLFLTLSKA